MSESQELRNTSLDLVERAKAGDADAYEQLYRENVGRIYAVCLRMARNRTVAEDLTQEAFIRAWQKLNSFRGDSQFSTWLHRLTVNVVLADRRSQGKRWALLMGTDELEPYEGAASRAAPLGSEGRSKGAHLDLEEAIAGLPDGARKVFVLYEIEGYRHEEIAQATGTAVGTSKAQLHRARKLLREALQA